MKTWLKESGKEIILNEEVDTESAARELGWMPKDEVVDNLAELAAKAEQERLAAEKAKADQEAADAAANAAQDSGSNDDDKPKPVEEMTLDELKAVAAEIGLNMAANIGEVKAREKVKKALEAK